MKKFPVYKIKDIAICDYLIYCLDKFGYNIDKLHDITIYDYIVLNLSGIFGDAANVSPNNLTVNNRYLCENILIFLNEAAKLKNIEFNFRLNYIKQIFCDSENEFKLMIKFLKSQNISLQDYGVENNKYVIIVNNDNDICLNYKDIYEYCNIENPNYLNNIENNIYCDEDYLLLLLI